MNQIIYPDFVHAINEVTQHFKNTGKVITTGSWQGQQKPIDFFETLNVSFSVMMPESMEIAAQHVKPNLPWADAHFEERVGGLPLNPGEQYKNWPFYKNNPSNDKFRVETDGKFSHSYMERIWPKFAGIGGGEMRIGSFHRGIRYSYGDLNDLVDLFEHDLETRQAYLPIWFPEDTGAVHNQRVPCTLGYHFIIRDRKLHVNYYIRSCDYLRHFRDDIYLTLKLAQWIGNQVSRKRGYQVSGITPGIFTMHITSLHIFDKEQNRLI